MTLQLRPKRGGFLRPFNWGLFVRDFLLGLGPHGSPKIDPNVGAPQADIFYEYKMALMREMAWDRAIRREEKRARRERRFIDPDRIMELANWFLARMPYKSWGCRYNSFVNRFSDLQRLCWVEFTGREEPSSFQDHYPPGQPRRYFRLTELGRKASDAAWSNPRLVLYGED